jgi:hypothetical protein
MLRLGQPVWKMAPNYWHSDNLDTDERPFYIFTFHYRTRRNCPSISIDLLIWGAEILEALGVIVVAVPQHEQSRDSSDTEVEDESPDDKIRRLKVISYIVRHGL